MTIHDRYAYEWNSLTTTIDGEPIYICQNKSAAHDTSIPPTPHPNPLSSSYPPQALSSSCLASEQFAIQFLRFFATINPAIRTISFSPPNSESSSTARYSLRVCRTIGRWLTVRRCSCLELWREQWRSTAQGERLDLVSGCHLFCSYLRVLRQCQTCYPALGGVPLASETLGLPGVFDVEGLLAGVSRPTRTCS